MDRRAVCPVCATTAQTGEALSARCIMLSARTVALFCERCAHMYPAPAGSGAGLRYKYVIRDNGVNADVPERPSE